VKETEIAALFTNELSLPSITLLTFQREAGRAIHCNEGACQPL